MENNDFKIDKLITEVHSEMDAPQIPDSFAKRLAHKFQIREMRKRLFEDWVLKLAVILGISACCVGIFYFLGEKLDLTVSIKLILPVLVLLLVIFVFFFDQVILKWMFFAKRHKQND